MNYKHFVILSLILIAVSIVRWNRQDLLIRPYVGADDKNLGQKLGYDVEMSLDSYNYVQYVNYYNGDNVGDEVTKPYSFRFLVPFLASLLPLDSFTSLNIINLSTELLGLLFLMKILALIGFRAKTIFITSFLYCFSFPIFYYGVVGLLDAPAVFLIILGIYFTLKNQLWAVIIVLLIGAMTNEKSILILPFFFFYHIKESGFKKSFLNSLLLFSVFVITSLLVRANTINADSTFLWSASLDSLYYNLGRIRTYVSLGLTGGLPLLIMLLSISKVDFKKSYNFAFLAGVIFVVLMIIYSFMAAYTDGRFMWYIYPFSLPLAAVGIEQWYNNAEVKN